MRCTTPAFGRRTLLMANPQSIEVLPPVSLTPPCSSSPPDVTPSCCGLWSTRARLPSPSGKRISLHHEGTPPIPLSRRRRARLRPPTPLAWALIRRRCVKDVTTKREERTTRYRRIRVALTVRTRVTRTQAAATEGVCGLTLFQRAVDADRAGFLVRYQYPLVSATESAGREACTMR